MKSKLLTDSETLEIIDTLKQTGALIADTNLAAGIATFCLCGNVVFKALRKGAAGQPWVVRFDARLLA